MKPAPLHERIRRAIEAQILSGAWPPGARVPGEIELMAQYGCARMTVNKALSALAHAGLVERRRRAGTFVARPRSQSMVLEITDLAREVTARGQVTFRKEVLQHLGIQPGELIELDLLPGGRGMLKAARPAGSMDGFIGLLAGRTRKVASLEEISLASAKGWAGRK